MTKQQKIDILENDNKKIIQSILKYLTATTEDDKKNGLNFIRSSIIKYCDKGQLETLKKMNLIN